MHPADTIRAHPRQPICVGTGLTPTTSALKGAHPAISAPGLFSPLPYLRRDCLPHLHQDYPRCYIGTILTPCHICAGTALSPATSAPGPG
jgi:hypothetical protein